MMQGLNINESMNMSLDIGQIFNQSMNKSLDLSKLFEEAVADEDENNEDEAIDFLSKALNEEKNASDISVHPDAQCISMSSIPCMARTVSQDSLTNLLTKEEENEIMSPKEYPALDDERDDEDDDVVQNLPLHTQSTASSIFSDILKIQGASSASSMSIQCFPLDKYPMIGEDNDDLNYAHEYDDGQSCDEGAKPMLTIQTFALDTPPFISFPIISSKKEKNSSIESIAPSSPKRSRKRRYSDDCQSPCTSFDDKRAKILRKSVC